MYKKLRFLTTMLLLAVCCGMWAEETLFYTLTPTAGTNNSYAGNCDITINGITWNVSGNSQQIPWRIGGNSITNVDRTVYSKTAMGSAISKVALTVGEASSITVNSLKLIVASDANFSNQIDEVSATFEDNTTINFTPTSGTEWATGAYYKFIFNVTVSGSKNKFVQFTKAEFYKNGGGETPTVAAPTFSRESGAVAYNTEITISQADDCLITYTIDGSDPTKESPLYGANTHIKITNITGETTIKAIAFDSQNNASAIASATYTVIHPNAPTFSPAAGAVEAGTEVFITAENNNYRIIYTTNGDEPSYNSNVGIVYDSPITIDAETTIKAIAVNIVDASNNIGIESPIASASYTVSTPFTGGDVTFVADTDKGSTTGNNSADQMTKSVVTISSTDAAFATAEYRMYKDSQTTISLSNAAIEGGYKITSIVFTGEGGKYPISGFEDPSTGAWNHKESLTGTWAGSATSIVFTAGAQVRATQIVVTVEIPKTLSSIAITTPPTKVTYMEGETFDPAGMVVTATYTDDSTAPVEGYKFTPDGALTMDDTNITISYTENEIIKTASQNITVTEAPSHTATFSVNGEVVSTANVKEGFAIEFPSNAEAPEGYSIVGWLTEEMSAPQNEAPANIISSAVMRNADVTYYAVLAICTTSGSQDTYALVSNIDDLNDGDKFILVSTGSYTSSGVSYDFTVANGEINENNLMDPVEVTISENKVTSTSVAPITLVAVEGGWKLQMGTQYLNIVSGENKIALDDEGAINTITINNNGLATIGGITDGSDTRNIYYNPNNGNGRFAYYKSSQKSVAIYKQDISTTYSNYCTTIPEPTISIAISDAGYATYVAADNVSFPEGVTAYIVSDVTASSIKLKEVLAVAKDVPVVVKGNAGTYDLEVVTADDCDDVNENKLLVSDGTVSDNILVLANKNKGVGFYTWAGGNLPAGKVYLVNPNSSREFFGFDEGVATSISTIDNGQLTMENAYNLQGQKVGSEYKGIVIVNGKKFINK